MCLIKSARVTRTKLNKAPSPAPLSVFGVKDQTPREFLVYYAVEELDDSGASVAGCVQALCSLTGFHVGAAMLMRAWSSKTTKTIVQASTDTE